MRYIIYIIPLFLVFSCGGSGIEGYVDEPITFTANNPEESQDVDYFWSLTDQPDGSLINSGDLISSNDGQEMVFTPDYPGAYSIEVIVSQYGDEISNQAWSFTILEYSEKELDNEIAEENEDWLNEELSDSIENENLKTLKPEKEPEVEKEEEEKEEEKEEEEEDGLNEPVVPNRAKKVSQLNTTDRIASIAARTDRYTIQITSKRMLKDAQLFSQKLIKKGYDSYIQKVVFNSEEIWFRVRVGSYDNYNSAKIAADALSDGLNMKTWVDFVRKEQ